MTRVDVLDHRLMLLCWAIAKECGVTSDDGVGCRQAAWCNLRLCCLLLLRWEMDTVAHVYDPSTLEADP